MTIDYLYNNGLNKKKLRLCLNKIDITIALNGSHPSWCKYVGIFFIVDSARSNLALVHLLHYVKPIARCAINVL